MNPNQTLKLLLAGMAALLLASPACAYDLKIKGAPDWVNDGTAYMRIQGYRGINGVGTSAAMGDNKLQLATADGRAKREVKRLLNDYLDALADDYLSRTRKADKQAVMQQFDALGKKLLPMAQRNALWQQSYTGILYSLVQLYVGTVKQVAADSPELDESIRKHIKKRADTVFDRVKRSAKKRRY